MQTSQHDFVPIIMQVLLAVGFVAGTIVISNLLGPKRSSANKDKSFECGIESVGNARIPFSVKYFLVAISIRFVRCRSNFHVSLGRKFQRNGTWKD